MRNPARKDGTTLTSDELIAWGREHLGGYKYPRELQIADSVALTAVGKIDRKALRRRLSSPNPS